jgi:transcriptional regulator NrdR family protein
MSIVTTREKVDLEDVLLVITDKNSTPYDKAKLTISILHVFDSNGLNANDVYWITETVENKLIKHRKLPGTLPLKVTLAQLIETTYDTLTNYHPVAGLSYGTAHGLVTPTNKRRRGRPSLRR